ncbi:hypothetical protein [Streptomyces sp. TLI_171]|uniref:hypothetical protein n=1 Tax=Streptomyces sp. TLI_171 TaxID=1938859 RepID=UPI000C18C25A|nr:hypothetical protein [Streptomyces sp. TLI_171]RKE17927.1 hypothetical protein BX266_1198 [Streptomyces sp. TLI_171]
MAADLPMGVLGPGGEEETWRLLFDALSRLRPQIEPLGFQLLCNGARIDAYPSGMSRDMGGGRTLYVLTPGRTPRQRVAVFDRAAPSSVGTVAAQPAFYESWLAGPEERPLTDRARNALTELWLRLRTR